MPSIPNPALSATATRPTFARYGLIAFIFALAVITYLDRACISTLAPNIMSDLGLSQHQMSWVFTSFAIAYAIFEMPTAWWADRRGTRRVLTRIVLWWSLLTILTACVLTPAFIENSLPALGHSAAWILSFALILSVRFLFGIGEAGAWPCAAASFARWIPARQRGFAQSMLFAGAHISGGLTPLLVIFLLSTGIHWRLIFILFGIVGILWAIAWYFWYRDDPAQHPRVNAVELQNIITGRAPPAQHSEGSIYWKRLFSNRNIIPLCLMYIGNSYAYYFCITWLPTYVKEKHHMDGAAMGIAAGLPLTLSVLGDVFGGMTTDFLCKRFGTRIGRSALGASMYALAAICMTIAAIAPWPWVAIGALSIAVASVMFTLGAAWGTVIEIGGHHTGMVGAIMNTAGNTAAIFSPNVAIYIKDFTGDWSSPLYVMAALFAIG
ncbi:MAG TPA: MFS transporter, partial [Phycisphaerae bacterium]